MALGSVARPNPHLWMTLCISRLVKCRCGGSRASLGRPSGVGRSRRLARKTLAGPRLRPGARSTPVLPGTPKEARVFARARGRRRQRSPSSGLGSVSWRPLQHRPRLGSIATRRPIGKRPEIGAQWRGRAWGSPGGAWVAGSAPPEANGVAREPGEISGWSLMRAPWSRVQAVTERVDPDRRPHRRAVARTDRSTAGSTTDRAHRTRKAPS